jgi:hypothetical protein
MTFVRMIDQRIGCQAVAIVKDKKVRSSGDGLFFLEKRRKRFRSRILSIMILKTVVMTVKGAAGYEGIN